MSQNTIVSSTEKKRLSHTSGSESHINIKEEVAVEFIPRVGE